MRLPAVGTVAANLVMVRYPSPLENDQPVGAGVVQAVLDLGAPLDAVEVAEVGLPPEVGDVSHPLVGPSVVRLHVAGREVARVDVAGGYRPVVAIGGVLTTTEATLVHQSVRQGTAAPLSVTAEGAIPLRHDGGTVRITLAGRPDGASTASAVAGWLEDAVEVEGVDRRLGLAMAAAHLFEPGPSARPWALVPGWPAPEYQRDAPLLPRQHEPEKKLRIAADTGLPWFAAAPVALAADATQQHELPGTRVRSVHLRANTSGPPITVELDAGGTTRTIELTGEPRTLRFLHGPGDDGGYRWRTADGPWHTGQSTHLVVGPDD